MEQPKISVIVPVYKVEPYLRKCVDSIVNQTYTNLEIILVDDGSPDACGAICDEYAAKDKRIKVIHKENSGVSSARNAGLDAATGDYIGFVDSDDWIEPEMYEQLFESLERSQTDMAASIQKNRKEDAQIVISGEELLKCSFRYIRKSGRTYEIHGFFSAIYSANLIKGIRFPEGFPIGEDFLFWIYICHITQTCAVCEKSYYHIVYHEGSAYATQPLYKRTRGDYETILRCIDRYSWDEQTLPFIIEHLISVSFIQMNADAQQGNRAEFFSVRKQLQQYKTIWWKHLREYRSKYQVGLIIMSIAPHLLYLFSVYQMRLGKWKNVK